MSLHVQTAQAGTPRQRGEGLRVGAVRLLPRGVSKRDYARKNYFDVWLPTLAPSRPLLSRILKSGMPVTAFFQHYRKEMESTGPRQVIKLLAEIAKRTPITVCCYCDDETRCHRSVLLKLIRKANQSH
ncbi:MAG: DUF488 family protein [Nitrospirae bacterium]|nr:MAG: DUF488 family protein [Nitrospirota bacterium]